MKFWRLRDSQGDPLYLDPARIVAVYLSGSEDGETSEERGQVRILLDRGSYFTLDDGSGLQVLEYFERNSAAPGLESESEARRRS